MQQQAGAGHVAQKLDAQTGAVGGALDQPGNVGDHETLVGAQADHAKIRHQRGERVVRHPRRGRRNGTDEGGFAGIRKAEQADIGQQTQLQLQLAHIAGRTRRGLARRAVDRGLEMDIAQPALAALRHQHALTMAGEVADHLIGVDVGDHGAHRHADRGVLAALAVHLAAHAVFAALRLEAALMAKVDQRIEALISDQPDRTAVAAVAAVGAAERNELLAAEADAAVAAIAGMDLDVGFVDEFHGCGSGERGSWEGKISCSRLTANGHRRRSRFPALKSKSPAEAGPSLPHRERLTPERRRRNDGSCRRES